MTTVHVEASKAYDIVIGSGLLDEAGERAAEVIRGRRAALVSETNVYPIYGARVEQSLRRAGFEVFSYVFPAGEASKTLDTFTKLVNFFADNNLSRTGCAVALGGGVTGDLTGFAASAYCRGIDYIQIPTTLLSAVDSSVGGKTAVDLPAGKNLAGCFWQPSLVLCDYDTLNTLPDSVYTDGCAEVIKYGLLGNADFFRELGEKHVREQIEHVITVCVTMKRDIVHEDEYDTGIRGLLNFGHTFGHAVESLSSFSISHGSAVAIGSAMICRAAAAKGYCSKADADTAVSLLQSYGLPTDPPFPAGEIFRASHADKKLNGSFLDLIVPTAIGSSFMRKTPMEEIPGWIEEGYPKN